jgi:hypothetical protein
MRNGRHVRIPLSALALGLMFIAPLLRASDDDCLACHSDRQLKSAQGRALFVDQERFKTSIHGQAGIGCVDCHADLMKVKDFPHAEKLKPVACVSCHGAEETEIRASIHGQPQEGPNPIIVFCKDCHGTHDIRGKDDSESSVYSLNLPDTCESCHLQRVRTQRGSELIRQYNLSVHFRALEKSGLSLSATCVTCHGGHGVRAVKDGESRVSRKNIIRTCGRCHVGIEKTYLDGVHGKDYIKGSADVPVCIDCHSEHDIVSPETLGSRVYGTKVSAVCSRCHDDERLARQYGFLTSRLKSYSASYHGTASKFGEIRVANCASCHGFHDIRVSSDPKSSINPANMSKTCGKCHLGASSNFAKGKVHVISEKTESRGSYVAKVIYMSIIGGMVSIFLIFIAADLYRRKRKRRSP